MYLNKIFNCLYWIQIIDWIKWNFFSSRVIFMHVERRSFEKFWNKRESREKWIVNKIMNAIFSSPFTKREILDVNHWSVIWIKCIFSQYLLLVLLSFEECLYVRVLDSLYNAYIIHHVRYSTTYSCSRWSRLMNYWLKRSLCSSNLII